MSVVVVVIALATAAAKSTGPTSKDIAHILLTVNQRVKNFSLYKIGLLISCLKNHKVGA